MIEERDGNVRGALLYARVKRNPSAARRSRFGVRSGGPPNAPTRSLRKVSMVMRRMLHPAHAPARIGVGATSRRHASHESTMAMIVRATRVVWRGVLLMRSA